MDDVDQDIIISDDTDGVPDDGLDPRKMTPAQVKARGFMPTPILAVIREKCLECAGGSRVEVRLCGSGNCPLWPYRMGTNPFRRTEMTDDKREELVERGRRLAEKGKAAREAKNPSATATPTTDVLVTVKQREAFEIILKISNGKMSDIHGKTLGSMVRAGWINNDGETPMMTALGVTIVQQLGMSADNVVVVEASVIPDKPCVVLTEKQNEAFDILVNRPRKIGTIPTRTRNFMTKTGWTIDEGGQLTLTDAGVVIAKSLGLIKDVAA